MMLKICLSASRFAFVATYLFCSFTVSQAIADSAKGPTKQDVPDSGVRSAVYLARYLGYKVSTAQASDLYRAHPEGKTSLLAVQQMVQQLGVKVEGVRITVEELEKRHQPFIAVISENFIFVERVEGGWVRLIENDDLIARPRMDFEHKFKGIALVLPTAPSPNTLQISPSFVSWGALPFGGEEKTAEVTLSNTGQKTISIQDVTTSCSCTVPSQWPKEILPGQKATLQIVVHPPAMGPFSQTVSIASDGAYPYQSISLFGRVEEDIRLAPTQLHFGNVVIGTTASRTLTLRDLEQKLPRPLKVSTTAPYLKAQVLEKEAGIFEILVALQAPDEASKIEEKLLVSGSAQGGRIILIPISGSVVMMTRALPEQIVFGSVSSLGSTRTIRVFRQDKQSFKVIKVTAPAYLVCAFSEANGNQSEWNVKVQILPLTAPSQVSATITIETEREGKAEEITIPVTALVESHNALPDKKVQ